MAKAAKKPKRKGPIKASMKAASKPTGYAKMTPPPKGCSGK